MSRPDREYGKIHIPALKNQWPGWENHPARRTSDLVLANAILQSSLAEAKLDKEESTRCILNLANLLDTTVALLGATDFEASLQRLLDSVPTLIPSAHTGILYLVNPDKSTLEKSVSAEYLPGEIQIRSSQQYNQLAVRACMEQRAASIGELSNEPREKSRGKPKIHLAHSALVSPLLVNGAGIGVLLVLSAKRNAFSKIDLEIFERLAKVAAPVIAKLQALAAAIEQSVTDPLTGLYNRRGLMELGKRELDRAHRFRRALACLLIDIDQFKSVNDRFGHQAGDLVLEQVARRLASTVRHVDVVSRYGGDEFALLLPETTLSTGRLLGERLRLAIAETPIMVEQHQLRVTASAGVARIDDHTLDVTDLLENADAALYLAKQNGRNRVETHSQT